MQNILEILSGKWKSAENINLAINDINILETQVRKTAEDVLCDSYALNFSLMRDFELFSKCYWTFFVQKSTRGIIDYFAIARYIVLAIRYDDNFRRKYLGTLSLSLSDSEKLKGIADMIRDEIKKFSYLNVDLKLCYTMKKERRDKYWNDVAALVNQLDEYFGDIFDKVRNYTESEFWLTSNNLLRGLSGEDIDKDIKDAMLKGYTIDNSMESTKHLIMPHRFYSNILLRAFLKWIFEEDKENAKRVKRVERDYYNECFIRRQDMSKVLIDRDGRIIIWDTKKRMEFFLLRLSLINSLTAADTYLKWNTCKSVMRSPEVRAIEDE